VATGCGTAIASVCAFGLFQIERLLGGLWSVGAVVLAGLLCAVLASAFARLTEVVPSGAGLIAYLSRGLGRRAGVLLALPYLLLTLFLVGAEATIVGVLFARVLPAPPIAFAIAFVIATWTLCRAGVRVSHRVQSIATWALIGSLAALSFATIAREAARGQLLHRLAPPAPSPAVFIAAVGQALFLFMGFELITSQAEIAAPSAIRRGLRVSVVVLTAFYAIVSLGFSCMGGISAGSGSTLLPQLGMAERAGGPIAVVAVAILSLLASFTSFNGALLALSRFLAALASQGVLPRRLAKVTPRGLIPDAALVALLACALSLLRSSPPPYRRRSSMPVASGSARGSHSRLPRAPWRALSPAAPSRWGSSSSEPALLRTPDLIAAPRSRSSARRSRPRARLLTEGLAQTSAALTEPGRAARSPA
jgi:amino acid transporter